MEIKHFHSGFKNIALILSNKDSGHSKSCEMYIVYKLLGNETVLKDEEVREKIENFLPGAQRHRYINNLNGHFTRNASKDK